MNYTKTRNKVSRDLLLRWELRREKVLATSFRVQGTEADEAQRIRRAREDYAFFVRTYFSHIATAPSAKFQISAADSIKGDNAARNIYMWARGMAKTSNVATLIPLWLLIQEKPLFRFMVLVSKSQEAATELLQDLQAELEDNEALRHDFGDLSAAGTGDWSVGRFVTSNGVTFKALGRGQSPRGLKKRGNRPDYIVVDDIDDDELCQNPQRVAKVTEWVMSSLFGTMQAGRGRFIIVGNLIGKVSVMARIIEDYKTFTLSQVNILNAKGEPNWPENHTPEEIAQLRRDMGERLFNREYMNDPVTEGTIFKRQYIRYVKPLPLERYATIISYTDPSWKSGKQNDYKATILVGKTRDGYYHILRCYADQTTVSEMVQWHYQIDAFVGVRKPVRYYMEAGLIQDLLLDEFHKAGATVGHQIPVTPDKRKKPNKADRIEALQPLFERGLILISEHEKESPGVAVLIAQLLGFDRGSRMHDDAPDALEGAIALLNRRTPTEGHTYRRAQALDRHY